jgi:hypothetical protein
MSGKVALRVLLMAAAIAFVMVGATSPGPLMPRADAQAKAVGPAKSNALARRILRHKEHGLEREERHHKREVHREKRQISHIKRELHHLRKPR